MLTTAPDNFKTTAYLLLDLPVTLTSKCCFPEILRVAGDAVTPKIKPPELS